MAPEQLESGETSRVSDVFSAAVVLWEALAGERLFSGKNHAETAFKILSAPIAPPSTRNPAIPAALDAVLMRGLARAPAERYATAREMALAIEQSVPGVRPSDLARWVEEIVGDRLDARLSELRAIEQSSDDADVDTQANTHVRARSARGRASSGARYAVWAVVLLAMSALATLAARRLSPEARVPPPPTAATPQPEATTGQDSVASPTPSGATETPRAEGVAAPPETSARTKSPAKLRVRSERRTKHDQKSACDPPFTIDANGHRLFKPECMQ
ncbi:MAG TPA: hypothetical protein VFN67_07900 [Polyangiales bacterium]|nr:hypothetical protein [Polyangiales bacterium]